MKMFLPGTTSEVSELNLQRTSTIGNIAPTCSRDVRLVTSSEDGPQSAAYSVLRMLSNLGNVLVNLTIQFATVLDGLGPDKSWSNY